MIYLVRLSLEQVGKNVALNNDVIPCAYCWQFPTVVTRLEDSGDIKGAFAYCENKSCVEYKRHTRMRKSMVMLAEEWNEMN